MVVWLTMTRWMCHHHEHRFNHTNSVHFRPRALRLSTQSCCCCCCLQVPTSFSFSFIFWWPTSCINVPHSSQIIFSLVEMSLFCLVEVIWLDSLSCSSISPTDDVVTSVLLLCACISQFVSSPLCPQVVPARRDNLQRTPLAISLIICSMLLCFVSSHSAQSSLFGSDNAATISIVLCYILRFPSISASLSFSSSNWTFLRHNQRVTSKSPLAVMITTPSSLIAKACLNSGHLISTSSSLAWRPLVLMVGPHLRWPLMSCVYNRGPPQIHWTSPQVTNITNMIVLSTA